MLKLFSQMRFPRFLKRFRGAEEGTTAIEFAIVGGPFFLLIFAILETSLYFFAGQYLENSVDSVARKIRTGQLKDITTVQDFQTAICSEITVLFDCEGEMKFRVEVKATFDGLSDAPKPDSDGNLEDSTFEPPGPQEIVQVTATYLWPIYTNYAAPLAHSPAGNFALMNASTVVRTEPFN